MTVVATQIDQEPVIGKLDDSLGQIVGHGGLAMIFWHEILPSFAALPLYRAHGTSGTQAKSMQALDDAGGIYAP